MMRQNHQQKMGLRQKQTLSQSARQLVDMVVLPPHEFSDLIGQRSENNPFLRFAPLRSPGAAIAAVMPTPTQTPSLFAHVLQEMPLIIRNQADMPVAVRLAEGLDERGYLVDSLTEIAADLQVSSAGVERVLAQLQDIEPVGLFARSVAECFALQLRAKGELDEAAVLLLANLGSLAAAGAAEFARRNNLAPERVHHLIGLITKLRRIPAAAFGETESVAFPELHFERKNGAWCVAATLPSAPRLSLLTSEYDRALAAAPDAETQGNLRHLWREAKALHQAASLRDSTLLELGKQILASQKIGLDSRFETLAPLTQREVAERLSIHESTVSRIVRHRFALVEGRVLPLARFFERAVATKGRATLTRSMVLNALRDILASDPAGATMSDLGLTQALARAGIEIPRRRVGKYREILGVPSSHRRKQPLIQPLG